MALTNINSDWVSNAYSGLCIIYAGPFIRILGCKYIILYYTILYYIILYYIILYYIILYYITLHSIRLDYTGSSSCILGVNS